ncbi:hypothetical protein N7470_000603 [Penicillium chermesinum]|nr:hypothetical protein N7470_000581 [Penicillium chermesinum]KAJ6171536.1 hypothetical protein N7470_000603 [Penicillium chermesinum]
MGLLPHSNQRGHGLQRQQPASNRDPVTRPRTNQQQSGLNRASGVFKIKHRAADRPPWTVCEEALLQDLPQAKWNEEAKSELSHLYHRGRQEEARDVVLYCERNENAMESSGGHALAIEGP